MKHNFIIIMCMLLCINVVYASDNIDLYNTAQLYYKLEEPATPYADEVNGINGICSSCPTTDTGIINNGTHFDGTNNEITLSTNSIVNSGNDSFSVNVWIKLDACNDREDIFGQYNGTLPSTGLRVDCRAGAKEIIWIVGLNGANSLRYDPGINSYPDNTDWHMLTAIRRSPIHAEVWLDGVNLTGGVLTQTLTPTLIEDSWSIGSWGAGQPNKLDGVIDEFSYYDVALNESEIIFLNASGSPNSNQQYPFESTNISYFHVSAIDYFNTSTINNFNVSYIQQIIIENATSTTWGTNATDNNYSTCLNNPYPAATWSEYINLTNYNYSDIYFKYDNHLGAHYNEKINNVCLTESIIQIKHNYSNGYANALCFNGLNWVNSGLSTVVGFCDFEFRVNKQSTTTGIINTGILSTDTTLYNFTLESLGYYDGLYNNFTVSSNLEAELNKTHRLYNITYSNYYTYLNNNYVRNLSYFANYTCPSFSNTRLELYVDGNYIKYHNLTCDNSTHSITSSYQTTTEGNKSIYLYMNTSYLPSTNNINSSVSYFVWDLNDPVAIANFTATTGFNNHTSNVTMTCTDTITPLLLYNLSFNSVVLNYGNQTNNTQIWNSSTITDGNNTVTGICSDFFSSDTYTDTILVYARTLALIDEKENIAFNVWNITGARVYFDDNSSFYDFQTGNSSSINFTSIGVQKLRFELVYSDGSIITRYVDNTLIDDEELRVCANKEGITHYEQLILSATKKKALLKNVFSNCYVAADYTRFAYQDAYILKAYTIASLYYLHADINGVTTYLASVDGSIPTYINLDTLEFQQTAYNLNILRDALSISETSDPDIVQIYYRNIADDNTEADITITRMDTSTVVFTLTETASPNEWTVLFDKSTLTNVTNQTLFKIQVDKTTAAGVSTVKRYFNFNGSSGVLSSGFAFVIAILITVFGLTFTVARLTFSYFGVITQIIAIAFISFATMTWYLLFLLGMDIIILVFIIMLMFKQNYPTVS